MRKVYTINSQVEFHEISNDGVILNIKAFQYGVLHYQIKNGKVVFYSNADENPWRNEVWSVDMHVTINDEVYSTADEVAEALSAVMNDSYQEQLDALQTAIDNEQARATNAEDALDSKIDLEIQNRINAVSGLTERVADDEASTGAALVDLNNKINAVSGENASQNVQISGLTNSINTEISRATSVENALRSDLTNETSARTNADTAMLERIVAVEVGKADANNVYTKLESDNKYATKDYISGLTDEFQEKLVAGENITISGNVISAVGGGVTPSEVQEMIDSSISGKADSDDVYTKNEVYTKSEVDEAIAEIDLSDYYTKSEVDASQLAQDNKINAISGDVQTLNEKVDTISGESVTSGEVQTQIDNSISGKADKTDIYTYVGTDRITVTNTTGTRRKAIDLNLPIYKGSGILSISCNNMQGTGEGNNNIQGMTSFGAGFDIRTFNNFEAAFGTANNTAGNSTVFQGSSGNTLFTVGNGSASNKHNAFEIRQNGDIYISDTNASGEYYQKPMIKLQDAIGQGGGGVTTGEVQTMIDSSISGKADSNSVYSKTESDNKYQLKGDYVTGAQMSEFTYDKQTIDDKIAEGGQFDPTQYYNKTQTNALLDLKADTANTYTKSEVNGLVADKADTTALTQVNNAVTAHTANTTVHITSAERTSWDAKPNVWCGDETAWSQISASTQSGTIYLVY